MKLAIIYYSGTGNTQKMANEIVKGIKEIPGMEAETFSIDNVDALYIKECEGVIVGTPTYYGSLSGAIKLWLENVPNLYDLSGKLTGAFSTAAYIHGGGDIAVQSILSHLLITGALTYSGGCAYGSPTIHLGPVALDSDLESYFSLFRIYGKRFATQLFQLRGIDKEYIQQKN